MPDLPGPQGLYDPRSSTTPAASPSSSTCTAARSHRIVRAGPAVAVQPRPPRRHRAPRPTPATAPASCSRSPTASSGRSSTSSCPPAGAYAVGIALPARATRGAGRRPWRRIEKIVASEGLRVLGWRDVPVDDSMIGAAWPATSSRRSASSSSPAPTASRVTGIDLDRRCVRRPQAHRARARPRRTASTSRASAPARSSTRGCSPRRQLGEFFPDLPTSGSSRALALVHSPVLAPTRSRRGRWPTRTGSSPTTARSTRCRATATGCGPARRCSASDLLPAASSAPSRSARPGASDTRQLRRGARAAPPRRPHAARTPC